MFTEILQASYMSIFPIGFTAQLSIYCILKGFFWTNIVNHVITKAIDSWGFCQR